MYLPGIMVAGLFLVGPNLTVQVGSGRVWMTRPDCCEFGDPPSKGIPFVLRDPHYLPYGIPSHLKVIVLSESFFFQFFDIFFVQFFNLPYLFSCFFSPKY